MVGCTYYENRGDYGAKGSSLGYGDPCFESINIDDLP